MQSLQDALVNAMSKGNGGGANGGECRGSSVGGDGRTGYCVGNGRGSPSVGRRAPMTPVRMHMPVRTSTGRSNPMGRNGPCEPSGGDGLRHHVGTASPARSQCSWADGPVPVGNSMHKRSRNLPDFFSGCVSSSRFGTPSRAANSAELRGNARIDGFASVSGGGNVRQLDTPTRMGTPPRMGTSSRAGVDQSMRGLFQQR